MNKQITNHIFDKLIEIVKRRSPELLSFSFFIPPKPLTEEEREAIREVLADEFCEFGLKENFEPNDYGIFIDDLIGKLGNF